VDEEDLLQIEFITQVLLVPNPISKQVVITCQAKYYLGQELTTYKLHLGMCLVLKTRAFWVDEEDLLQIEFMEPSMRVPNLISKQVVASCP
jgi:hypothetical protein